MAPNLTQLMIYFLKLGATGFGGPAALVSHMQRDLVVERKWVSELEFQQGIALAQMAPGPLATQLAIYLGWSKHKTAGAFGVLVAFVLPSFVAVVTLAAFYVRWNNWEPLRAALLVMTPVVLAIMTKHTFRLSRNLAKKENFRIIYLLVMATLFFYYGEVWFVFLMGIVIFWIHSRFKEQSLPAFGFLIGSADVESLPKKLWDLFEYFAGVGALVFGSGYVIVPFLREGVVVERHWLTEPQFLDAIAVAVMTPGPVVIAVAFIGFLVAGILGAAVSTLGIFLPCFLLTILFGPLAHKTTQSKTAELIVEAITLAAVGAIIGAVVKLGWSTLNSWWNVTLFIGAFFLQLRFQRLPDPVLVLAGLGLGFLLALT